MKTAADDTATGSDDGAARAEAVAVPAGDTAAPERAERDGDRLALAPALQERAVIPPVKPEPGVATRAAPDVARTEAERAGAAKASDDLAKPIDTRPATGRVAGPDEAEPASESDADSDSETAGVAIAVPEEGTEAVPQAKWSPQAAAPVPAPAPRIARLSELLVQQGRDRDSETAGSRPQEARRAAPEATAPELTGSVAQRRAAAAPAQRESSRQQSGAAPPRIVVHYRGTSGASAARRVADELRARGFGRTELRPVSFGISQANVRYFHDQNRPVARELNDLLGSMWRRSDLRDFTHYAPLPSVGTVEVWLPG